VIDVQQPECHLTLVRTSRLQHRYKGRRLEILRAAGREFRNRGFAATGMREIAAAAELSPANLYNYFRGKDEILFFCQDSALDRLIANLEKTRRSRATAIQKLRAVIAFHLHCVLDQVEGSAAHLLTTSIPARLQTRLLGKRDRYEQGVRQLIAAGMRSGEFVSTNPAVATRIILGALNSTIPWFDPQGPLSTEQLAHDLANYLVRGLCSERASAQAQAAPPILTILDQTSRSLRAQNSTSAQIRRASNTQIRKKSKAGSL
jgi:AcrR family transcriptional regulator